ncbi:MAG: UDP-N-acetylmuramate--L-alanine ligase [Flammeovirgaceae bacterium]
MKMDFENIYLVGVGGIGMSAIARWFNTQGLTVAGYDKTATPLTEALVNEGIDIHFEDNIALIPKGMIAEKSATLVVYTPAIPADHNELTWLKAEGFTVKKRSEVLGLITQDNFTIAVAGTHGKTTTSSMIAHILKSANHNFVAFLGGLTANYGSNLIINQNPDEDLVVVVEADEYDRSFLHLSPDIGVVTSVEADHLDIYGSAEAIEKAFAEFVGKLKDEGVLFLQNRVTTDVLAQLQDGVEVRPYGIDEGAFRAESLRVENGISYFDVVVDDDANEVCDLALAVPGRHNAENATAAISVCLSLGLEPEEIQTGLSSFKGVKRRFEFIHRTDEVVYIDDYAHHPTEVGAFLEGVRGLYPNKKLTVIFQPHLFTRTRDFAQGFSESLSIADELLLLNIYPAREEPIEGVDANLILNQVTTKAKQLVADDELIELLKTKELEVLVTVGAGNIDRFVNQIKAVLETKQATAS